MTTVIDYLRRVARVDVPAGSPPVCRTIATEIRADRAPRSRRQGRLTVAVETAARGRDRLSLRVDASGDGRLVASRARHLYAFYRWLVECRGEEPLASWRRRTLRPTFRWMRPVFDLYFTQSARTVRNLDRDAYVREMARLGFTHLEVNGLAAPEPIEEGVPGEVYPSFYTYCPALDQFVDSFLVRGLYPADHLRANLDRLRADARRAARYGLVPALLCFEPRSVPERLLARYPELRGCRVDHPFRSFRPRYNLAVGHPVVRDHYREMMRNLLEAVPELGCLAVWTNDSGAGLEFTRTLYVGANGSAYLAREWSADDVFAKAAAENALGFLRLLREAAAEVNPRFRVTTRLEPFGPEREAVLAGVGRGVDVETPSLLGSGWEAPYGHPTFDDADVAHFTVLHQGFSFDETAPMRRLAARDCRTHVTFAHGPGNEFEPLLGLPWPWLTHDKLVAMRDAKVDYLAHWGGIAPPDSAPFPVNEEVFRRVQLDPALDLETTLGEVAAGWVGDDDAPTLVEAWRAADEAIRGFDGIPLYVSWGVWYRVWIRPLVPDIEAIPEEDRAYYERHLLSTHHNPNRFDLSRDVLFDLATPAVARRAARRIECHALPAVERGVGIARSRAGAHAAFADLADRLEALACWMTTRRNVAVWIAEVRGFVESRGRRNLAASRRRLRAMVASEIESTRRLLDLWRAGRTEFMAVSDGEETTFVYDRRFGEHLERKIDLMERYGDRAPRIDPDVMWRVAGLA
jgi:hypothetical protein